MIETTLEKITPVRFIMKQTVLRGETVLFRALVTVACMDDTGRPVRVPEALRVLLP